jgi:FtsP/CotA-like multicopper oxidase with cupredoxin domain
MKANVMKKIQRNCFKRNPVAAALALALAVQFSANLAHANGAYGTNTDISGATINVPTYYANSPQGVQPAFDLVTHAYSTTGATVDTGTPMRKFVDALPGVDAGGPGVGIPLAITEKWKNPLTGVQTGDDYYEIAIVAYNQQMHSDLPKATSLRGYVQIETPAIAAGLADAAGVKSEHFALTYPDGTVIKDAKGNQVFAVHKPSYLGPIILASRGTAVRMKYTNYLPYTDINGKHVGSPNGGEMLIPVDEYIAGGGPVSKADGTPYMLNGKPVKFSQNRADIHWHGGDTPWISDGTPHQWVAPAGDASYAFKDATHPNGMGRGDSAENVPDMPDPGPGSGTLYFPNNLSARLMFYHDHTSGLTKLNVYEGMAAGYVVTDPAEQSLVTSGAVPATLLGVGIPLVIQDKTFVPKNIGAGAKASDGTPQSQDAKWDLNHWGQPGDLWFPHVYEVNQDPNSLDGTNPVGRWDWGPWFWPVFPSQYSLPSGNYGDVTATPEAFMDTSVVNGMAYPTLTVDPVATRLRILSVPNDRTTNLSLYQAVDAAGAICDAASSPAPNVPALGGTALPATCTEIKMVPAKTTAGFPADWPTDGRAGGVPDPATAGPDMIQIGNEAGLLPAPATWHAQPVTYDQNVRSMTVFNVLKHSLLLGGGERADVVIDFSAYAGKTLILYNDAPAPMPGFDPRIDYYTGVGDQSGGGGAYDTPPGYGPNTRTIMQFKVNPTATGLAENSLPVGAPAFSTATLAKDLPAAYAASQPKPNIPETAYNIAFPGIATQDNYAQIFTGSKSAPALSYPIPGYVDIGTVDPATGLLTLANAATITAPGAGYTSNPIVTVVGGGGTGATATAKISRSGATNGQVTGVTMTNGGTGYTRTPNLVFSGGGNPTVVAAASVVTVPAAKRIHVINKAIQELFDPVYGRMNATLAVELPFSTATVATTIPLAYIDAPIDSIDGIKDGETQVWKITHNGVDSHPVHFHLVNVQVINRVDWAGVVKPPEANEIGWKETLRMNPLEDVYVAARAVHPVTPFGLPKSKRVLDPSAVVGSQLGFTQIDQLTGNAPTFQTQIVGGVTKNVATTAYSNQLTDFDNEYVWHCHILGHEENDFMRPFIFHPDVVVPDAPGKVSVSGSTVTWTDPTPFGGQDAQGIPTAGLDANGNPVSSPKNEIGFYVQQTLSGKFTTLATLPANVTSWTDASVKSANRYDVVAFNAAGNSAPGTSQTASSGSTAAVAGGSAAAAAAAVAASTAATTASTTAAATAATAAASATATAATNAAADAALVAKAALDAVAFSGANPGTVSGAITLTWANNPSNVSTSGYTNVTGFTLTWTGPTSGVATATGTPTGATITGLTPGGSYTFTLVANAPAGSSTGVTATATAP